MLTLGLWHSTAWWEWRQIQRLRRAGIPTMVPVAFGEKLRGCFERRSFLVTEAVPGQSLERWVPARLEVVGTPGAHATAAAARRRDLISQLARLVAALHGAGLVHRDLYLSHIFVSFDDAGRSLLHLIDLTRVFRPRWRRSRWIVKDLAALNFSSPAQHVSQTDRVRFLRAYLRCDKLDTHAKTLARRIAAKTRRMARHNRDTVNVASDERRNDAAPVAGATRPS
jgi:heptose I phosphotransferase